MSEAIVQHCFKIRRMLQSAVSSMNRLPQSSNTKAELWNEYQVVIKKCEEIMAVLGELHLPEFKPRVLERTDAGPGVGIHFGQIRNKQTDIARKSILQPALEILSTAFPEGRTLH